MKRSELELIANKLGYTINSYNPGDNISYKLQPFGKSYFQGEEIARCKKLSEVMEQLLIILAERIDK